jgi:hypothetical protein
VKQAKLLFDYGDTKCVDGFVSALWYKFMPKSKSSSPPPPPPPPQPPPPSSSSSSSLL